MNIAIRGNPKAQCHLEQVGQAFLHGYHAALEEGEPVRLVSRLDDVGGDLCGFAYEGAAMAMALLDDLTPWTGGRVRGFLNGPGLTHPYMIHVGMGWAMARLPWVRWRIGERLARLDPLLRWLAVDGYGFHEGYFHSPHTVTRQEVPSSLSGYTKRAFDQGLGRSLWFVGGADVDWIAKTIAAFHPLRREDLWSGVGLACAYAGGVEQEAIISLRQSAGVYQPHVAQGVAFAAKARQRAGNPALHTEMACTVLCGCPADAAAKITDIALEDLPPDGEVPAYEVWRQRIRNHFTGWESGMGERFKGFPLENGA